MSDDPLFGLTAAEVEREVVRLVARIEEITAHLARFHYSQGNPVRANLERERDGLAAEAHALETALIEVRTARRNDLSWKAYGHPARWRDRLHW